MLRKLYCDDFFIILIVVCIVMAFTAVGLYIHEDATNIVTINATIEEVLPIQMLWINTGKSITPIYQYYVKVNDETKIIKINVGQDRWKTVCPTFCKTNRWSALYGST